MYDWLRLSDGGWLFWTMSDIKDFKMGYAALPKAKTNKHINFNDFWIMGRWSTNKDAAWFYPDPKEVGSGLRKDQGWPYTR